MEKSTKNDAITFIQEVKQLFGNGNLYNEFGAALDNFYHGRLSVEDLTASMKTLFENHKNLFSEFELFLPEKKQQESKRVFRIVLRNNKYSSYESKKQVCQGFLEKVKTRFETGNNMEVYNSVLNLMIKYKDRSLDIDQICEKIFVLFIGHADLIYEFEKFFEDQSCKTRKDVEKTRIRVIDDYMNEMEVMLWNLRTFIRRIKEVLRSLEENPFAEINNPFKRIINFRCFQRFYDKFGLENIQVLRNNPIETFPDVLIQLTEKEEEILRFRTTAHDFLIEIRGMHCNNARKRKAGVD
ncbi:hypothetical protein ACH5RR_007251 [Cinchona calisaya]|uniref:Uncharacterized protein n=1 Tax=Cinchona calisaya TaxID=153742 RepID=A0ABD3ARA7_9GENT